LECLGWSTPGHAGDKTIIQGLRHRSGHRNLYVLEGTTICGEVHATISRDEMAHMWHSRLGHMSNRYMTMLHEKELLSGLGKPFRRRVENNQAPRQVKDEASCYVQVHEAPRHVEPIYKINFRILGALCYGKAKP
jgi:hypothetical protein